MNNKEFDKKILGIFAETPFDKAMAEIKKYKYTDKQKETIHAEWMSFNWDGEDTNFEELGELEKFLGFND